MAKHRSREDLKHEMSRSLESALDSLQNIWDEIGIVADMRRERTEVVMLHLRNLLEEMVREEETLKSKLMHNMETYGEELLKLCQELGLPAHEPKDGLTILELEKDLRTRVDTLAKEKHDRMKKLKKMRETDQHLCDILCTTPYYIPSGTVPSNDQLESLENHIQTLKEEKERRQSLFITTKKSIIKLMEDLDQCPNTSFERDIICEQDDSFLLSSDNMKALRILHEELEQRQKENFAEASQLQEQMNVLWERLQIPEEDKTAFNTKHTGFKISTIKAIKEEIARCQLLKIENIRTVIEGARRDLLEWWQKCYFSKEQQEEFKPYFSDDYSEELLELHDQELQRVKQYYADNQEMLELVARRQELWGQFLEFERKASDPNRFFNRGCNLLKEEKARKKLMKELPKVEADVKEQIDAWEKRHNRKFLVGGAPFVDFIATQWEVYKRQKECEKEQRHQQKAKQMEEEMIYGSKPVTPAKRRFATPGKTPNKLRKLNETPKTPGSVSRLGISRPNHTSIFASPACMPPRSTSKTPTGRWLRSQTNNKSRKALAEKNGSNETLFSHTTVSGNQMGVTSSSNTSSVSSVGPYNDFAIGVKNRNLKQKGLNQNARPNCRSSVAPRGAYF